MRSDTLANDENFDKIMDTFHTESKYQITNAYTNTNTESAINRRKQRFQTEKMDIDEA